MKKKGIPLKHPDHAKKVAKDHAKPFTMRANAPRGMEGDAPGEPEDNEGCQV